MRDKVVVVGSGMMGCGIAARSVLAGNPTTLVDSVKEKKKKALADTKKCIDELKENGLADAEQAQRAEILLTFSSDTEAAVENARMVIEAVFENLQIKQEVFRQIDAILPPAYPICSNTSGLRITDIAQLTRHPERIMTTHFWFPAHLVPLVGRGSHE